MEYRVLGKTGLRVSALGFGCGDVGGLIVRGTPADRERAVARALEIGINYFDTAPSYGAGQSELHLGQALGALGADAYVGTKFRLRPEHLADIGGAVTRSLEESLKRLGRDRVDLLQLHNQIFEGRNAGAVSASDVLDEVVPALRRLQQQGKTRFYGITALGETQALHRLIDAGVLDTAQVCYNLLNPSAGVEVGPGFPAHDFRGLLGRARAQRVGVIGIRALAGGALSGVEARHPVAMPSVAPIASGPDYATDVRRARSFSVLVEDGHAESLPEAALRFVLGSDAVSTVLLGYSSLEQLEGAAAAVAKGPLPRPAIDRLGRRWAELANPAA